jgi:aryl-phospho-beta-D-glucosidase BglC (GH1 family)
MPSGTYPQVDRFTKEKIAALRFAGFDAFRLPVVFEQIAEANEPYTINFDQTAFHLLDSMILWAQEMDFKLIIDNHHGYVLTDDNYLAEQERIKAVWKQLIIKYDYLDPNRYFFELYNEPSVGISNDNFRALAQYVLDEVRSTEKQVHTFFIGSNFANSPTTLLTFTPLVDSNIIYTFHTYDPFAFTKQGFSWTNPPFLPSRGFPEFDDIELLYRIFEGAQYWADFHKVPVSLGEFGSSFAADSVSRCAYIYTISGHIYNNNMSYFYWDAAQFYDAYGYYNGEIVTLDSVWYCFKDALQLYGMIAINDLTQTSQMSLNVSPNPSTGTTYLRLEGELKQLRRYILYDNTGREVYAQPIDENGNEALISLELGAFNKGLYRLVLYADNGKTWHRNIIVH